MAFLPSFHAWLIAIQRLFCVCWKSHKKRFQRKYEFELDSKSLTSYLLLEALSRAFFILFLCGIKLEDCNEPVIERYTGGSNLCGQKTWKSGERHGLRQISASDERWSIQFLELLFFRLGEWEMSKRAQNEIRGELTVLRHCWMARQVHRLRKAENTSRRSPDWPHRHISWRWRKRKAKTVSHSFLNK